MLFDDLLITKLPIILLHPVGTSSIYVQKPAL